MIGSLLVSSVAASVAQQPNAMDSDESYLRSMLAVLNPSVVILVGSAAQYESLVRERVSSVSVWHEAGTRVHHQQCIDACRVLADAGSAELVLLGLPSGADQPAARRILTAARSLLAPTGILVVCHLLRVGWQAYTACWTQALNDWRVPVAPVVMLQRALIVGPFREEQQAKCA